MNCKVVAESGAIPISLSAAPPASGSDGFVLAIDAVLATPAVPVAEVRSPDTAATPPVLAQVVSPTAAVSPEPWPAPPIMGADVVAVAVKQDKVAAPTATAPMLPAAQVEPPPTATPAVSTNASALPETDEPGAAEPCVPTSPTTRSARPTLVEAEIGLDPDLIHFASAPDGPAGGSMIRDASTSVEVVEVEPADQGGGLDPGRPDAKLAQPMPFQTGDTPPPPLMMPPALAALGAAVLPALPQDRPAAAPKQVTEIARPLNGGTPIPAAAETLASAQAARAQPLSPLPSETGIGAATPEPAGQVRHEAGGSASASFPEVFDNVARAAIADGNLSGAPTTVVKRAAEQSLAEPIVAARPGQIGRDVGVEIARRLSEGGDELIVRLNPAELGRIEVRMSFDERGLRAFIAADSQVALDMLRRDSVELSRSLADAGVRSDSQSLRFQSDNGSGGGGQPRNPWAEAHAKAGRALPGDGSSDPSEQLSYRQVRTSGRYDLLA